MIPLIRLQQIAITIPPSESETDLVRLVGHEVPAIGLQVVFREAESTASTALRLSRDACLRRGVLG